ncbi:Chaperone SurA [Porphyromonas levii]|uniref:peptidylprolyl isomerase n=1 Tax=Porphyromonas levii TaxID=28114 RepID=UPI001B8BEF87|nr:peptidylprolyl isomerase [Porphyromonas levii]MBR8770652.1 Chaperone SurA [Porphyromonas levii]MBR8785444.1 Chaperone SurA [Porphyromonas levii]
MAVLERIRGLAWVVVAVIGLGLLAFILGDVGNWFSSVSRDGEMTAFMVNGNQIKIQDYETLVNQEQERYKQMGQNLGEAESFQIRNMVYQGMVAKQVLKEEAEKIGLAVGAEETMELIQGENPSPMVMQYFVDPKTGAFDRTALVNFLKQINAKGGTAEEQAMLSQSKAMWIKIEEDVRAERLAQKYGNLVAGAVVANKLEQAYQAKADGTLSDVAYVQRSVAQATDVNVEVSEADVKAYYDARKKLFTSYSGGADVDVIYTTITPSTQDFANAKADIAEADKALRAGQNPNLVLDDYSDVKYQDTYFTIEDFNNPIFPADFAGYLATASVGEVSNVYDTGSAISVAKLIDKKVAPSTLKVSHIMLAPVGAKTETPSVDSLLAIVKAEPTRFAELAKNYSLDTNSSVKGGEIGELNEATATQFLGVDFSNAIFGATVGVPFSFKSQYGEHIVMVTEAGESVEKYKVAFAQRTVRASSETQSAIYNQMSSFLAANKGNAIDSLALNQGYQVLPNTMVSADQPQLSMGIENSRSLIRWAMSAKPGEISDITECGDKYVFVRLNDSYSNGVIPFNYVKEQLTEVVKNEKKVDAMYEQLLAAKPSSLEAYATNVASVVDTLTAVKFNTPTLASIGFEPRLNAAAAFAKPGVVTPVKGLSSVYLINVLNRQEDSAAIADVKLQLNAQRKGYVRSQVLGQVIQKADIQDRRAKFQ